MGRLPSLTIAQHHEHWPKTSRPVETRQQSQLITLHEVFTTNGALNLETGKPVVNDGWSMMAGELVGELAGSIMKMLVTGSMMAA